MLNEASEVVPWPLKTYLAPQSGPSRYYLDSPERHAQRGMQYDLEYQTLLAQAAMNRLRIAVEALKLSASVENQGDGCDCRTCVSRRAVREALSRIGELPPP